MSSHPNQNQPTEEFVENQREHYRISVPMYEKVWLVVGNERFAVEEFSERGVRFLVDQPIELGLQVSGAVNHDTRKLFDVKGQILRSEPLGKNRWRVVVTNQCATMADVVAFQIHLIQHIPIPTVNC